MVTGECCIRWQTHPVRYVFDGEQPPDIKKVCLTAPSRKTVHTFRRSASPQTRAHQRHHCSVTAAKPWSDLSFWLVQQLILHKQRLKPSLAKMFLQSQQEELLLPTKVQYQVAAVYLTNARKLSTIHTERENFHHATPHPNHSHRGYKVPSKNNRGVMRIREQSTTGTRFIKLQPITHQESHKL